MTNKQLESLEDGLGLCWQKKTIEFPKRNVRRKTTAAPKNKAQSRGTDSEWESGVYWAK